MVSRERFALTDLPSRSLPVCFPVDPKAALCPQADLFSLGLPICIQSFVMLFFMNSSEACHKDHGCIREVSLPQHVKTKGSPNQKSGEQGHMHGNEDTCLSTRGPALSTGIPNLYPFYLQPLPLQPHPFLKLSPTCNHPSTCTHPPLQLSSLAPTSLPVPSPFYFQASLLAAISVRVHLAGWTLGGH